MRAQRAPHNYSGIHKPQPQRPKPNVEKRKYIYETGDFERSERNQFHIYISFFRTKDYTPQRRPIYESPRPCNIIFILSFSICIQ